jgi:hypothetical protein
MYLLKMYPTETYGESIPYEHFFQHRPADIYLSPRCLIKGTIRREVNCLEPGSCLQAMKDINETFATLYFNILFLPALST